MIEKGADEGEDDDGVTTPNVTNCTLAFMASRSDQSPSHELAEKRTLRGLVDNRHV